MATLRHLPQKIYSNRDKFFSGFSRFFTIIIFSFPLATHPQSSMFAADSVKALLDKTEKGREYVRLLYYVAKNQSNPDSAIHYSSKMILLSREIEDLELEYYGEMAKGNAIKQKGDYSRSSQAYIRAAEIASDIGFIRGIAYAKTNLAGLYKKFGNFNQSLALYKEGLQILIADGDSLNAGLVYSNLGYTYYLLNHLDSAHRYTQKSRYYIQNEGFGSIQYYKGNLALINLKKGHRNELDSLYLVIDRLRTVKDFFAVADYLSQLSSILMGQGELEEAIRAGEESLAISRPLGLKEQIRDASQYLSEIYQLKGDFEQSLRLFEQYIIYKDSTVNIEAINGLADMRTDFEVSQRQFEVDLLEAQNTRQHFLLMGIVLFFVLLLVFLIITFNNSKERGKITIKLESQKKDLEDLNQTKDRFFSIISHDLRGPVNAFHGVSRMIKFMVRNKQLDQLEELAEDIDQSVNRLSDLLDNLLNWAVQQQEHFSYVPEKLNVYAIVVDLQEVFNTMAQGKQITIGLNIPRDLDVWADRNTTHTIFRNLLSNALKFTPEGGTISLGARQVEEAIEFNVSDTGVGICQNKIEDLFKLQAQKSTWGTDGEKGLGLGLQLVQEFVALNKGTIKVQSQEGHGTTFVVNLPSFDENAAYAERATVHIAK